MKLSRPQSLGIGFVIALGVTLTVRVQRHGYTLRALNPWPDLAELREVMQPPLRDDYAEMQAKIVAAYAAQEAGRQATWEKKVGAERAVAEAEERALEKNLDPERLPLVEGYRVLFYCGWYPGFYDFGAGRYFPIELWGYHGSTSEDPNAFLVALSGTLFYQFKGIAQAVTVLLPAGTPMKESARITARAVGWISPSGKWAADLQPNPPGRWQVVFNELADPERRRSVTLPPSDPLLDINYTGWSPDEGAIDLKFEVGDYHEDAPAPSPYSLRVFAEGRTEKNPSGPAFDEKFSPMPARKGAVTAVIGKLNEGRSLWARKVFLRGRGADVSKTNLELVIKNRDFSVHRVIRDLDPKRIMECNAMTYAGAFR